MDRVLVYPGQIPLETDILNTNKYSMVGLSKLAAAVFGTSTLLNAFTCIPTGPASLQVQVTAGEMYSLQNIDGTAYSSIAADTTHQIMKQGILLDTVTLSAPAPGTGGQSINYLVQVAYSDSDALPIVLPYYNASNISQAYSGPNNAGTANNTVRKGLATVSIKAGVAATTGSQVTPAPDAGNTGMFVVTVANGQTTIIAGNISTLAGAPFITETLTQKISQAFADARYLTQNSSQITAIAGGTADALTVTFNPAITSISNQTVLVRAAFANATTTPTFAPNAVAAMTIVKANNLPLAPGDIAGAGHWLELTLDATLGKAVLQNPATGVYTSYSGQNYFLNPSFNVWQDTNGNAGTYSWTFAATSGRTADMVSSNSGTGGSPSKTVTRQAWAKSSAANINNNPYYYSSQQTANATSVGDSDFFGMEYAATFQGGSCTISALLWCASGTLVLTPTWLQNFGTGGSPSANTSTAPSGASTIAITTTPTLYTFTFNVPATTGKTFGSNNNDYCGLTLSRPLNTLSTMNVDSLKIEAGATATPYRAPVGGADLDQCKRYYEILGGSAANDFGFDAYNAATSGVGGSFSFITKRAIPTATKVGTWTLLNCAQPAVYAVGISSVAIYAVTSTTNSVYWFTAGVSTYISIDARLF